MAKRKVLESRRTERVHAGWRVLIPLPGMQTAEGRIYDVSAGGLQFASPQQYRRGEKISIDIITSPKNFVRTRIIILREAGKSGGHWVYGAKFINMTKLDRVLLESGLDDADMEEQEAPPEITPATPRRFPDLLSWLRK